MHGPALVAAAARGDIAEVCRLLGEGVGPNWADPASGTTALHAAAQYGHSSTARVLLRAGARADAQLPGSLATALHLAAAAGEPRVIRTLAAAPGASLLSKTAQGCTPLHEACFRGHRAAAEELMHAAVAAGSNDALQALLGARDCGGASALHAAAAGGWVECVQLLLSNGADPSVRDLTGRTPAEYAEHHQHEAAARLLRHAGSTGGACRSLPSAQPC